MLSQGYRFIASLPDGRIIVERPTAAASSTAAIADTAAATATPSTQQRAGGIKIQSGNGPGGIRTHDLCGLCLTQCECVIQTRLDDRSVWTRQYAAFLSFARLLGLACPCLPAH